MYCLHVVSASCRAVLRDNMTVVVELVNIVGTPSFSDLHVSAVHVLSNLLQDVDTVQVPALLIVLDVISSLLDMRCYMI